MKISYIIPITTDTGVRCNNTSIAMKYLADTFESILSQSIPNWELIIVVEKSLEHKVSVIWKKVAQSPNKYKDANNKPYSNVQIININSQNAAVACNKALELCKGRYVGLIQAGDQLAGTATYELIKCLVENPKAQFLYTNHDHLDIQGTRFKPFFKPNLSPDLLYCQNYIRNLVLIKKSLLKRLHGWSNKFSAAYDYELTLNAISTLIKLDHPNPKLLGNQSPIKHIPKVLYHQRANIKVNPKSKQTLEIMPSKIDEAKQSQQGLTLLKHFFKLQKRNVTVKKIKPMLYRHQWAIPKPEPLVSLIIPTRDGYDILKTCVQSILEKTNYKNYEILIVDNQSTDPETIEYMENLEKKYLNIHILKYNKPFNYSAINNYAVTNAKGPILGFINNDTEVITPEWLTEMVSHAIRPEIGCVGAMLYYPDSTIQHAGVTIGICGKVDHAFRGFNENNNECFNILNSIRNPLAVTAAVLLVRKILFEDNNGFDEINYKIEFNDVDLCLKIRNVGFTNIFTPYSKFFHEESKTRKLDKRNYQEYLNLKKKYCNFEGLKNGFY